MGDWDGTVPSIFAGSIPTGDDWAAIIAELTAETFWTGYDPAPLWTASTSNPAIGNGFSTGGYVRNVTKAMDYGIIVAGSTTTFGTGTWRLGWPVTPSSLANTGGGFIGSCYVQDNSAGAQYVSQLVSSSTSFMTIITSPTTVTANTVTPTVPFTWAQSDRFSWFRLWEAAS